MPILMRRFFLLGLLAVLLLIPPRPALSLSLCGILCSCTVATTNITLSNYNPIDMSTATGTGTVTASCQLLSGLLTLLEPYTISLSQGIGTFATRTMIGPSSAKLNYNLYSDAEFGTIWGDGTGGSQTVGTSLTLSTAGLNVNQALTVYALVPGGQNVPLGTYMDTITATLTF